MSDETWFCLGLSLCCIGLIGVALMIPTIVYH